MYGYNQTMGKLFLKKKKKKTDEAELIKSQCARIDELKAEVAALSAELKKYRENGDAVTDAWRLARMKAKEYEQEAKIRFALECERLDIYREKWTGAVKNLEKAEKLGEEVIKTEKLMRQYAREIREMIDDDLPTDTPQDEVFYEESERLAAHNAPVASSAKEYMPDEELKNLLNQLMKRKSAEE